MATETTTQTVIEEVKGKPPVLSVFLYHLCSQFCGHVWFCVPCGWFCVRFCVPRFRATYVILWVATVTWKRVSDDDTATTERSDGPDTLWTPSSMAGVTPLLLISTPLHSACHFATCSGHKKTEACSGRGFACSGFPNGAFLTPKPTTITTITNSGL